MRIGPTPAANAVDVRRSTSELAFVLVFRTIALSPYTPNLDPVLVPMPTLPFASIRMRSVGRGAGSAFAPLEVPKEIAEPRIEVGPPTLVFTFKIWMYASSVFPLVAGFRNAP